MSDNTGIPWTDATFNPITGCTKISEGCRHCYAQRMATRLAGRFGYPKLAPFTPATEHPNEWSKVDKWKKPRRVFVCSMGDLFHDGVTHNQIERVLDLCQHHPQHTFQLLTKRPARLTEFDYPSNVWLGTTIESAKETFRADQLMDAEATVRFFSCEPLLGPIDMVDCLTNDMVDWVIVGAETGPNKRPMDLDWARKIRDDCAAAEIPFFFKKDSQGNGTLDGVEHHAFPEVPHA